MKKLGVFLLLMLMSCAAVAQSSKPSAARTDSTDELAGPRYADEQAPQLGARKASPNALLPSGTALYFRLERVVSTRGNKPGDTFIARLSRPVLVNGIVVVPAGASLNGTVLNTQEPRRYAGHSSIGLRPESILMTDGTVINITAVIVDTADPGRYKVTDEGRIKGPGVHGLQNVETVALSGTGAVAGVIVAGPVGMLVGAGSGAAISGGHALIKRHEMVVPTSLEIIAELNRPASAHSNTRAALDPQ